MNQVEGKHDPPGRWLTADEACARLAVKRATLYAYVSRGKVRAQPTHEGRRRRYLATDVERLAARSGARAGHGAVAAGALRWGEPVLDTSISGIEADGPWYRGRSAVAWARRGATFEEVAAWLWAAPAAAEPWPRAALPAGIEPLVAGARPIDAMAIAIPCLARVDPTRHAASPAATMERARGLIRAAVAAIALASGGAAAATACLDATSVAAALALALGQRPTRRLVTALDEVLVVSADHELNASSFAARVAASAGADLHACLAAALATLSGSRHGGVPERLEVVLDEIARPEHAARVVQSRLRRGDGVPGFGHPLYPDGDPRVPVMRAAAARIGRRRRRLALVEALAGAMDLAGAEPPNYDLGVTAVASAMGLRANAATAIFAVGRCAGWVAHVLEQRAAGYLLRPRARYVAPPP